MTSRVGVHGAAGRMGRMLIAQIAATPGATLAGAVVRPGHRDLGADAGSIAGVAPLGVALADDPAALLGQSDVVIDFTLPAPTAALAAAAADAGTALVIGTTGLGPEQQAAIDAAAGRIAIVQAANMSLGVVLLDALVERVAATLGPDYDIEIVEMHHRHKVDAPSGTALALGEAAARGRGGRLQDLRLPAREGHTGPRPAGGIGFAALRGGDVVGDHVVTFAGDGERIELAHRSANRRIYAAGAVRAALWLIGRAPGRYGMRDVLGLA